MKNTNNLQRHRFRNAHHPAIPERLNDPETHWKRSQVFADPARMGVAHQEIARGIHRLLDAIRRIDTVSSYVTPDFKQIVYCLWREPISAHLQRFSAAHSCFFASIREQTSPASTNSPRRAAAYPCSIFARISLDCSASHVSCSCSSATARPPFSSTLLYRPCSTSCWITASNSGRSSIFIPTVYSRPFPVGRFSSPSRLPPTLRAPRP
jgi:hypothetical protein